MKKLIYALVAIMCGVCVVNAGEMQEVFCKDKSLSYCIKHYDKQCEAKNYVACWAVGELQHEQKQYSESKKYFEMVCDKADSKDSYQIEAIQLSCGKVAAYYYKGAGVRQDYVKSLKYNKKACDLGDAQSCVLAGGAYYLGIGTKIDYKLAKNYYEKSCEMQNGSGCRRLGAMYGNGEGVSKNLSKAKELFGKACDFGEQNGCDGYKELNEAGVK